MTGISQSAWLQLLRHPTDPPSFAPFHLESSIQLQKELDRLKVSFRITGPISELLWPKERTSNELERGHQLWQHTCFELFVSSSQSPAYCEWNFSSTKQWDHFHFDSYRQTSNSQQIVNAIQKIDFKKTANSALIDVEIDLLKIPTLAKILSNGETIFVSTTVVLENKKSEKSYWALSHQDSQPDFHNKNSFIAKIL